MYESINQMDNDKLHDLTDKEEPNNLKALEKKIKKEQKKKEKPKLNPKSVFGNNYKEPKLKKKSK